ncbi:hypothetical protein [Inquilinus sp. CAU 1745]|uniref:hypothetical protein n=1 Tax=Inquilinus sp. CAU 1745 TaxID=3140369 RepID=UPI00325B7191
MADHSALHRMHGIKEAPVDSATVFESGRCAHLHGWWAACEAGEPPPKKAFDITDHGGIVAHLFLVQRNASGFTFRLYGEEAIHILGVNPSGMSVRTFSMERYGYDLEEYYRTVCDSRRCYRCSGRLAMAAREHFRFESVDCPLTDAAGGISHIIGVIDLIERVNAPALAEGDDERR